MCQGFPLVSVGDFFLAYSQNQLLWWQKSVGVPITCGFIQWGAEGALLSLSPIKLFRDEGAQHFSEPSHDVQDWASQDSCLWALTMQSEQRFFFPFFILIVYLQNRFQQLKSIYGLMEKPTVGGSLALKKGEPHQWQREESTQGRQGKERRGSRGNLQRCLQTALPKSLALPPSCRSQEDKHCISI